MKVIGYLSVLDHIDNEFNIDIEIKDECDDTVISIPIDFNIIYALGTG